MPDALLAVARSEGMRPLVADDAAELWWPADDRRIWHFHPAFDVRTPADMAAWCEDALRGRDEGHMEPFVFVDAHGILCGSSRLMRIDRAAGACEIGATWFGAGWWGTAANARGKRRMLDRAFADPGRERVYFSVDIRNRRSVDAMRRLGAPLEGVLRNHMRCRDGHRRATAMFSILRTQWPGLRERLDARLARLEARDTEPAAAFHAVDRDWMSVVPIEAARTHDLRHVGLRPEEPRAVVDYTEDHGTGASHYGAIAAARLVGVASVYDERHERIPALPARRIRGMAVEELLRGHGIGARLLRAIAAQARRDGVTCLWCNARDGADVFYARHGFEAVGDPLVHAETGHHHHLMCRSLRPGNAA